MSPSSPSVLDTLSALLEHSLIRQISFAAESRFYMLQTIREYALEQLAARGELNTAKQRHAAYFCTLVEHAEPHLTGPEQTAWMDRLEIEHDNLRAALAWATDTGEAAIGLRLASALHHFWYVRGHFSEGRRWLAAMAEQARNEVSLAPLRAKALSAASYLTAYLGEFEAAFALGETGLAIAREVGDKHELAGPCFAWGQPRASAARTTGPPRCSRRRWSSIAKPAIATGWRVPSTISA